MTRLPNAVLCGLFSGLVAGILDTRQSAFALNSAMEIALVLLQATARLGLAGTLLGIVVALLVSAGDRTIRTRPLGAAVALALAASPGLIYIALRLFQGGATSKLEFRYALIAITALALITLFWLVAKIALILINRADRGELKGFLSVLVFGALILTALGLRWCDAHLYRRLYLYLHSALGLATIGSLALALKITVLRGKAGRGRKRFSAVALGVILALYIAAQLCLNVRHSVKTAIWEHTATLASLLHATSLSQDTPSRARLSDEILSLQKQRARRAKAISEGDWPVFPNAHVLLITIDALRADRMGIYGHTARQLTPNLDKWARNGAVIFEYAYSPAPHSSYSITSLHTSRFTHDEAMLSNEIKHATIAEVFKNHGYKTEAFYTQGIFFTEGDMVGHYRRSQFGFDKVTPGAPPPEELTEKAIEVIDNVAENREQPSFLWFHYFNVHEPYRSTRFGTSPADRYDGEILEADTHVIRLIEHAQEVLGNVIIGLSADHGEEFNDHGGYYHGSSLYEEQIRVPLVIQIPQGRTGLVHTPVSIVGLAPSLLRLVGIDPPATMLGQDLRPAVFRGDEGHVVEPVFASVMRQHMVISWPWKLITDPSRKLYNLYNLKSDPHERVNLYDRNKTKANELLQEIYGWIDRISKGENEARTALNLGSMRDLRAVPVLIQLAINSGAPKSERIKAIHLLREIRDYSAITSLKRLLKDDDEQIAIAAALALGELGDASGRDLMYEALFEVDPAVRDRAALALARLNDLEAIPALIEALGRDDVKIREQAIRMLGYLGDPRATEPLITVLSEYRLRYLSILALGKIGDFRAYEALLKVLDEADQTDVRGYATVALGWMERPEGAERLVRMLREEPEIKWTTESLIRLGAVGRAPLYGTDIRKGLFSLRSGFDHCIEKPKIVHGEFLGRTTCRTKSPVAELSFFADAKEGATVILRARHLLADKSRLRELNILVDGSKVGGVELSGEFREFRIDTGKEIWSPGHHRVLLALKGIDTFEVDHFLVLASD